MSLWMSEVIRESKCNTILKRGFLVMLAKQPNIFVSPHVGGVLGINGL